MKVRYPFEAFSFINRAGCGIVQDNPLEKPYHFLFPKSAFFLQPAAQDVEKSLLVNADEIVSDVGMEVPGGLAVVVSDLSHELAKTPDGLCAFITTTGKGVSDHPRSHRGPGGKTMKCWTTRSRKSAAKISRCLGLFVTKHIEGDGS